MAGFLYYFPGSTPGQIKLPQLREWGLGYAFEDRAIPALVTRGPDGQRGVVVADPRRVAENDLGFWPERQRWEPIPPNIAGHAQGAWIGFATGREIRPEDLVREQPLAGHYVRLADGQRWLVPVARKSLPTEDQPLRYSLALPHVAGLDPATGEWTAAQVMPRYHLLWRTAETFWDALMGAVLTDDGNAALTFADTLDAAVIALEANYRVGKVEATLLGLLTHEHAIEVLYALVDWPTALAWCKKKEAVGDGSSIAPGPKGATPATAPRAPISGHSP